MYDRRLILWKIKFPVLRTNAVNNYQREPFPSNVVNKVSIFVVNMSCHCLKIDWFCGIFTKDIDLVNKERVSIGPIILRVDFQVAPLLSDNFHHSNFSPLCTLFWLIWSPHSPPFGIPFSGILHTVWVTRSFSRFIYIINTPSNPFDFPCVFQ